MEIPLTPPVEKLLGSLKKYTPVVNNRTPRFTSKNAFKFALVSIGGRSFAPASFAISIASKFLISPSNPCDSTTEEGVFQPFLRKNTSAIFCGGVFAKNQA